MNYQMDDMGQLGKAPSITRIFSYRLKADGTGEIYSLSAQMGRREPNITRFDPAISIDKKIVQKFNGKIPQNILSDIHYQYRLNKKNSTINGITYEEGDFHTPGQSGYEGISYNPGDYVTPGTSGLGEMPYFDYVKNYPRNAAILFTVGAIGGAVLFFIYNKYAKKA